MTPFDALLDQRISSPLWPEPVHILRLSPSGESFEVWAEGLETGRTHKRFLTSKVLLELSQNLAAEADFGADADLFALGVEARRIELGHTFDPFFAVSTSRIDPLPHQLEAVYGTLLQKPRVRFLLADDPGAGKTVMAGLLLKELKYRGVLERVLIVTPANLTDQWRRELKEKFGESFEVVNRDTASARYDENPWTRAPFVIMSVDFAKNEPHVHALEHARWDLVIVDEAHKLSARRYGREVRKSKRYRLGEVLSRTSERLLFLTATPHGGDDEAFRLLLDLLEPDLFATRALLEEAAREDENPLMLRRLKEDMTDFEGKPLFPPRYVHTPEFKLTPSERALYERVTDYVAKHFKRAWSEKKRNIGLTMTVLQRRLASSSHAIARSLDNRHKRLVALKEEVSRLGDDPLWNLSDEDLEDLPEEERWAFEDALAERLTLADNLPDLEREIRELKSLAEEATLLARLEQDRKLSELVKILERLGDEKLLVFTEHKDTLDFLVRVLQKKRYVVCSIDGSMRLEDRIAAERAFRDHAQVMVATEAAGEGINLQFCSVMVNYDIPWNPTRLEQRMGRVHRYGQGFDVHIYNLVAQGTREGDVLGTLLAKLEVMRHQLGSDRVYDVVGELLADVNLEGLISEHLLGRKTLAEIQAMVDARLSPERVDFIREITLEALAKRQLDLSRLRVQKRDSDVHRLQPEYIERFFGRAFTRLGGSIDRRQDGLLKFKVPFELRRHQEGVRAEYPRATFDKRLGGDAEFIGPGHALFDAVLARTLSDAAPALRQGAAFSLPHAARGGVLAHLELAVIDGTGATVSRRLYAVQEGLSQDSQEPPTLHTVEPRVLVDAEPGDAPPEKLNVQEAKERMRGWAHDHLLNGFLNEVTEARGREVAIRRKYARKSLEHLIRESTKKLTAYKVKQRQGDEMALAILQEERRGRALKERLAALEKQFAQEESLYPEPAELVSLAYVHPPRVSQVESPATESDPLEPDPKVRRRVELAAMQVVIDFERAQGREPQDVSAQNVGYDIDSGDRAVEVKGRGGSGAVTLTFNEWTMAKRLEDLYFLYIVTHALTNPTLHIVQNPAARLEAHQEISVVQVVIPQSA